MSDEEFQLDDDLRAFVEERLGNPYASDPPVDEPDPDETDASEDTEDEPGTEDQGEPGEPGEGTTEPDAQSGVISLAPGVAITHDQALSYYQLDAIMRERPDVQEELKRLIQTPKQEQRQEPSLPPLPELDEYATDEQKSLHESYKAQRAYLESLQNEVNQLRDVTVNREQEEIISLVQTTSESFKTEHGLTNEQMKRVQDTAERLNILPALMRGVDPVTGENAPRDRTLALNRAFEIAYWYLPEMREAAITKAVEDRSKRTRKKQRLAGVSGSSGSMPKEPPAPRTEQERRNAMVNEVAQMLNGTHEE